jgi:hypothetical protein
MTGDFKLRQVVNLKLTRTRKSAASRNRRRAELALSWVKHWAQSEVLIIRVAGGPGRRRGRQVTRSQRGNITLAPSVTHHFDLVARLAPQTHANAWL